ncbi:hypothetical protein [Methanosarcina barkeri]|uniref:hypothetical protein n=1 Tax=Methanosarcina barkeri TaxID=2208 RepID=UPI0006CF7B03|nr:hypothetical protein [Methanosarcina barkeri]
MNKKNVPKLFVHKGIFALVCIFLLLTPVSIASATVSGGQVTGGFYEIYLSTAGFFSDGNSDTFYTSCRESRAPHDRDSRRKKQAL